MHTHKHTHTNTHANIPPTTFLGLRLAVHLQKKGIPSQTLTVVCVCVCVCTQWVGEV